MSGGTGACIAIDWGTSNRRAYRIDADGTVGNVVRDDRGVLAVPAGEFPAEIASLRDRLNAEEVIAAGMIGSTRGWVDVPYVWPPAGIDVLAAGVREAAPGVLVIPGVALTAGPRRDVMRGEEVQVLGAGAGGLASADGLFCQPGTHNKWIQVRGDRIVDFATAMTGELFALLREHGILAGMLDGDVADGDAFRAGLERGAGARDLATALFEVRAEVLLGARAAADAAAYASGILIGADVGAREDVAGHDVHLIGTGSLADLYAVAIQRAGGACVRVDAEAAFIAGVSALRKLLS